MFSNFTEEARNIIVLAKQEMKKLKHPYVGSEHFLLAFLKIYGKKSLRKLVKKGLLRNLMIVGIKLRNICFLH